MDGSGRQLPDPRATGVLARTIYRQLRRAGYSKADVVHFVNQLVDFITDEPSDDYAITDPESALATSEVLLDSLGLAMRQARDTRDTMLLLEFDVEVPDWAADEDARELHTRLARDLARAVRQGDTVGRMMTTAGYAVVLPGATLAAAAGIVERLRRSFTAARRAGDQTPPGVLRYRAIAFDGGTSATRGTTHPARAADVPERLLSCLAQEAWTTVDPSDEPPARWTARAHPPSAVPSPGEVVLALGGGAARAAAHIGVLRALRVAGVGVAGVAGTSAGAIVGAMSLLGMGDEAILERFETFTRSPVYLRMRRLYAAYRRAAHAPRAALNYFRQSGLAFISNVELAAVDDDTFQEFIEHFVGRDRPIEELERPFAAAATDLTTGRGVVLRSGSLHFALRASCAVPGLFRPQRLEGRALVDGSVICEVPVDAARALGADAPIVAAYLVRPEQEVAAFATSAEVSTRTMALVHKELLREQLRHAPEIITALVDDIAWLDFRKARATADVGFVAASAYLGTRASAR